MASTANVLLLIAIFVLHLVTITANHGAGQGTTVVNGKSEEKAGVPGQKVGGPEAPAKPAAPLSAPVPSTPEKGKRVRLPKKRDKWCVPKPNTSVEALQKNIDYICSRGLDCTDIKPGGVCYGQNNISYHAAYLMHIYFNINNRHDSACDFFGTATFTKVNPTKGSCIFK